MLLYFWVVPSGESLTTLAEVVPKPEIAERALVSKPGIAELSLSGEISSKGSAAASIDLSLL